MGVLSHHIFRFLKFTHRHRQIGEQTSVAAPSQVYPISTPEQSERQPWVGPASHDSFPTLTPSPHFGSQEDQEVGDPIEQFHSNSA